MSESTAVRYLEQARRTEHRLQYAPTTGAAIQYDPVRPWIQARNARAGIRESRWVRENDNILRNYRGLWVAILGEHGVLTAQTTLNEVYDFLKGQGFADALVMKVPAQGGKRPYLIA